MAFITLLKKYNPVSLQGVLHRELTQSISFLLSFLSVICSLCLQCCCSNHRDPSIGLGFHSHIHYSCKNTDKKSPQDFAVVPVLIQHFRCHSLPHENTPRHQTPLTKCNPSKHRSCRFTAFTMFQVVCFIERTWGGWTCWYTITMLKHKSHTAVNKQRLCPDICPVCFFILWMWYQHHLEVNCWLQKSTSSSPTWKKLPLIVTYIKKSAPCWKVDYTLLFWPLLSVIQPCRRSLKKSTVGQQTCGALLSCCGSWWPEKCRLPTYPTWR